MPEYESTITARLKRAGAILLGTLNLLEVYGKPFGESTLYRAAHPYESAAGWHRRRPPLPTGTDGH